MTRPGSGTVRRLLAFAAPDRPRFAAAAALGVLAVISVVALMAASAWLICAAALQPPLLVLSLAIVAVRAFALGRDAWSVHRRAAGAPDRVRALPTRIPAGRREGWGPDLQ
jgi:hypothetical protein